MFREVRIVNYKSFLDLEIHELKRMVLIGGDNNIGKTNFLEALLLLHQRQNPKMNLSHWAWRGIPKVPNDTAHFHAPLFYGFDTKRTISIAVRKPDETTQGVSLSVAQTDGLEIVDLIPASGSGSGHGRETTTAAPALLPEPLDIIIVDNGIECRGTLSYSVASDKSLNAQLNFSGVVPKIGRAFMMPCRGGMQPDDEAERLAEIDRSNAVPRLVKNMRLLAPELSDLSVIPMASENVVHCDIGLGEKVPLRLLGDGTVRFFQYLLGIAYAEGSVALIDEVDSGLHYSIQDRVFACLARAAAHYNCQLFCTTHSYECLERALKGLADGFREDFCYIRLERSENGVIAKYFDYQTLAAAIENRWEVR